MPNNYEFWDCIHNHKEKDFDFDFVKGLYNLDSDLISKNCFLTLFLILDHIHDPVNFIKKFLDFGISNILIMLEKTNPNKGIPIQHLSGWDEKTFRTFSEIIGFEINFLMKNLKIILLPHYQGKISLFLKN